MTHSLVLEIPENIYRPLAQEAKAKGRKIEEIALEKLIKIEPESFTDPLDKFIGAFNSYALDWIDNHDKHLGEQLAQDLQ